MSTDFDNELENSEWLNSEPIISSSANKPKQPIDDLFSSIIAEAEASYESSKNERSEPSKEDIHPENEPEPEKDPEITVTKRKNSRAGEIASKIKSSEMFKPDVLKDMFFGTHAQPQTDESFTDDDEEYEEEPALFDKRPRYTADVKKDRLIFEAEYSLTPEEAAEGYMLYHNEFVRRSNVKFSLLFATLSVMFLISILFSPRTPLLYIFFLVCVLLIVLKWLTSSGAKRAAVKAAERVKNDSYKLSFFSSRIIIKCSELSGDTLYTYPPVMIRFEDIDLKVIDYDDLYVLIFKGDMIYTVPKSSFTDRMNDVFTAHLMNILGDDYIEFFTRKKHELPKLGGKKRFDENNEMS